MSRLGPFEENTIICGDCLDIMARMPDACVDLALIDPPYTPPMRYYDTRKEFRRTLADFGISESFFKIVFDELGRLLGNTGNLLVFCNGQSYPIFFSVAYGHFKHFRPLIWDKVVSINGYYWRHQHELIGLGIGYEAPLVKTGDGDILRFRAVPVAERLHQAQKPEDLTKALILKASSKDTLVADFFMGSGTTAVVADRLGRKFFGCDINPDYVEMALERLEKDRAARQLNLL